MGTKARQLLGSHADEMITLLNKALADEWLAYYQYWIGAKVVHGPMRPSVQEELMEHANDELKHAGMLAERIIQLGGTPLLSPDEWKKATTCGYDAPKDSHVLKIIAQNVKGEQCAIVTYNAIIEKAREYKDTVTFHIVRSILQDEMEHEQDLQDLEVDIKAI